jgi:hypothetical protein
MAEGEGDLSKIIASIASAHQQTADAADRIADSAARHARYAKRQAKAAERLADATEFMFSLGGLDEASSALSRAIHSKPAERG